VERDKPEDKIQKNRLKGGSHLFWVRRERQTAPRNCKIKEKNPSKEFGRQEFSSSQVSRKEKKKG